MTTTSGRYTWDKRIAGGGRPSAVAWHPSQAGRALLLGLAYCLGLGIPFLLVALGFGGVTGSLAGRSA